MNSEEQMNSDKEKQIIEQTIRDSIGWAKDKDFDLLYKLNIGDESYLEVHPEDRVVLGFSQFRKMEKFWKNDDFKAVRYSINDLHITISSAGNVAWWYCLLDDINEWKGQPCSWENVRWTGVMEKFDQQWKIRQMHFSYPEKKINRAKNEK